MKSPTELFAENFAGRKVKASPEVEAGWNIPAGSAIGRIVGFEKRPMTGIVFVVVEITGELFFGRGSDKNKIPYTETAKTITDNPSFWRFYVNELEVLPSIEKLAPYPHNCKFCKSPARKVGKTIICSRFCSKARKSLNIYKKAQ